MVCLEDVHHYLLSYLPDISKWNMNNVTNMSGMFLECSNIILSKVIETILG